MKPKRTGTTRLPDANEDFWDLEELQILRLQGSDKAGHRILRIVAPMISPERLKRYIFYKIFTELPERPFSILYMHTTVQIEDNSVSNEE